jgi:hypothetical protein
MASKVRKKLKASLGSDVDHEMIPFAGPFYHYATMMEDGPTTRWGLPDAGMTDVMFEKRKKGKKKNG